jgi:hypothetical protein
MRLEEKTVREPDLLFVSTEHLERVKETYLDGPTDLIERLRKQGLLPE